MEYIRKPLRMCGVELTWLDWRTRFMAEHRSLTGRKMRSRLFYWNEIRPHYNMGMLPEDAAAKYCRMEKAA